MSTWCSSWGVGSFLSFVGDGDLAGEAALLLTGDLAGLTDLLSVGDLDGGAALLSFGVDERTESWLL